MKLFFTIKHILFVLFLCALSIGKAATFDNILKVVFYTENNQSYIILHESLYNITSGAYVQGKLRSQGYNSSRITVLNLKSGHMVAQKFMGPVDSSSACLVLGCSPNNLWIYSQQYKSGLQSLHPLTLERNISQAKIYSKLNTSIGRFMHPDWHNIKSFYDFDEIQQKLIVTNTDNNQFYIDVNTFAAEPIKERLKLNNELNKYLSTEATFKDSLWQLDGFDYTKFKCGNTEASKPTFLYGKFILEQNKTCLFKHFYNIQEQLVIDDIQLTESQKKIIERAQTNIKDIIVGAKPDEVLLQPQKNSFLVLSKSNQTAEALLKISKIESKKFGIFNEAWSVSPPGMFYNVAQARNTSLFKKYFGDIYPEFDFKFFQVCNNKLIVIYLLYISCIDVDTGEIIWHSKLK